MLKPYFQPYPKGRGIFLSFFSAAFIAGMFLLVPPFAQDPAYHQFADQRAFLGVANAWNVLSNLPFIVVGILGLTAMRGQNANTAYRVFFSGVFLTGFGSAYYHLAPANYTLLWDRLPMTLAFMGFFTTVLLRAGLQQSVRLLFPVLLLLGPGTVFYWQWTEGLGRGDLRPYVLVQFLPLLLIPMILYLYRTPAHYNRNIAAVLALYILSKLCELGDGLVYQLSAHLVSGHSLKHLFAAGGAFLIWRFCRLPAEERGI